MRHMGTSIVVYLTSMKISVLEMELRLMSYLQTCQLHQTELWQWWSQRNPGKFPTEIAHYIKQVSALAVFGNAMSYSEKQVLPEEKGISIPDWHKQLFAIFYLWIRTTVNHNESEVMRTFLFSRHFMISSNVQSSIVGGTWKWRSLVSSANGR